MVASDLISDFCSMNVSFRLQQESGYNQFPNWTIYIFQSFLFSSNQMYILENKFFKAFNFTNIC